MPNWVLAILRRHRIREPYWLLPVKYYWQSQGRLPNIVRPRTFNEKILYRIFFDRRRIWTEIADKAACRSFVESRIGGAFLPKLYWLTTDPANIPFEQFPEKFVVKATHGSGWVELVKDKTKVDREALIEKCRGWLTLNFSIYGERHYRNIPPRIIVEEFIDNGGGQPPKDYKLFVFGGKVEMIQVDASRFSGHRRRLYRPDWERLPVQYEYEDIEGEVPAPPHLADMVAAGATLGRGLDFVRVDFYDIPDRLYFGELTATPDAGACRFRPQEFDHILGARWKLPTIDRLLMGKP